MLIATWNVNSFRAHADQVLGWLTRTQPDVVALQETMCTERELKISGLARLGYDVAAHSAGGRGGVALCSRLPMSNVQRGVVGASGPFAEPRLISATIDGVRIHSVYAPNGRKVGTPEHAIKLAWFHFLSSVLEAEGVPLEDAMVLGDLNIAPTDRDVWEPSRYRQRNLTSPKERAAFQALLALGLIDVVRQQRPTEPNFTWWNRRDDFYESDRGWRLDHVLATSGVASRVTELWIDRDVRSEVAASDHSPIVTRVDECGGRWRGDRRGPSR